MDMPGPSADHAGSASSHFMFVKRKDETAKEGDLPVCLFLMPSNAVLANTLYTSQSLDCWAEFQTNVASSFHSLKGGYPNFFFILP